MRWLPVIKKRVKGEKIQSKFPTPVEFERGDEPVVSTLPETTPDSQTEETVTYSVYS